MKNEATSPAHNLCAHHLAPHFVQRFAVGGLPLEPSVGCAPHQNALGLAGAGEEVVAGENYQPALRPFCL